jgi:hypothetical protein
MTRTDIIPLGGSVLLALPLMFIGSCLSGHPLSPAVLGNPFLLIGCLVLPIVANLWTIARIQIVPGKPMVLDTSFELRLPCLLVVVAGLLMSAVLVGYVFFENVRFAMVHSVL